MMIWYGTETTSRSFSSRYRRRAEIVDALAADRLPFDVSPKGERLRGYELASGRGCFACARPIDQAAALQRPARNGCDDSAASDKPIATNEANAIDEIATNEANAIDEILTNEANAIDEILTNEANTVDQANATNEANAVAEKVTNAPTLIDEITNEPKIAAQSDFPTGEPGLDFEMAGELKREARERRKRFRAEKLLVTRE